MRFGLPVLLLAVTVAIYAPLGGFDLIHYDDTELVYGLRPLQQGISAETIRWALTDNSGNYVHPVTTLAHLVAFSALGPDPGRQHLLNVAIFVVTVAALHLTLRAATDSDAVAFLGAALWAWHPLRVETVAWITERGGVISGLFTVLAIGAYLSYANRPRITMYLLTAACLTLAMLSKPVMPALPIAFLLLDLWPAGRLRGSWQRDRWRGVGRLVLEKVPLLVLAGVLSAMTLSNIIRNADGDPKPLLTSTDFALAIPSGVMWYVIKSVVPTDLGVHYPWVGAWSHLSGAFSAIVIVAVTTWLIWWRRDPLIAGWLWFVLMLLPLLLGARVRSSWVADRYSYLPHLLLCAGIAAEAISRRSTTHSGNTARAGILPRVAFIGILIILAISSALQVQNWRNSETLFTHTLAVTKDNAVIHMNLGVALAAENRFSEALEHYGEALRLAPNHPDPHVNMGVAMQSIGNLAEAERQLRLGIKLDPQRPTAHYNLGNVLKASGRAREAAAQYARSIQLKPDYLDAHVNLGAALEMLGDRAAALASYREALRLDPTDEDARANLDALLAGRPLALPSSTGPAQTAPAPRHE